jgi:hypothetical protein
MMHGQKTIKLKNDICVVRTNYIDGCIRLNLLKDKVYLRIT